MIGFEREEEEIVRYYEKIKAADMFGVWGEELLMRLPLKKATRFMKPDHGWDEESWAKCKRKKDHESIVNEFEDYFQFATEMAVAHRGMSASKTVFHFLAWSWLMNDMELFEYLMEPRNYPNFGAPMILAVAQKYDFLDLMPTNPIDYEVFMKMAKGGACQHACMRCGIGSPIEFRPFVAMPPPAKLILPK